MKQVFKMFLAGSEAVINLSNNLLLKKAKSFFIAPVMVLASMLFMCISCTKNELKPTAPSANSGGSGGAGGNGGGGVSPTPTPTPTTAPTPTTLPISDVVTVGTWKVSLYVEKVENSTKKFSNFTFTFVSNGTLLVKNGGSTITGTWIPAEAVFYYGIPSYGSNPNGFFISLSSGLPLSLLSKNFFVGFKSLSSFTLESINPAEDTHVTFSK